jgi:hypothetical protein
MHHSRTSSMNAGRKSSKPRRRLPCCLEILEMRTFLSVTQVSFANFASTTGLVPNSTGFSAPLTSGNKLEMLDGASISETRTVWWGQTVPVSTFTTSFAFTLSAQAALADGITFTIQDSSAGTAAIGGGGNELGYESIGKSVAFGLDWYNFGAYGSTFGFLSDGGFPTSTVNNDMTPVDLHNGDTYDVVATYDGTTLAVTVTDADALSDVYTDSEAVNISSTIGSTLGYVGFTAANGSKTSQPQILNWTYSGHDAPTLATTGSITPSPVDNLSGALSILGADDEGEDTLTYDWTLVKSPSGAKTPTFSDNDSNAAKNITARFFKAGHYDFRCTITDGTDLSVTDLVSFNVAQTAKRLHISPHAVAITEDKTEDYTARAYDQFGHLMSPEPTFAYSILEGSGSINPTTGVYTAPDSAGHLVIKVAAGNVTGTAGAVVLA